MGSNSWRRNLASGPLQISQIGHLKSVEALKNYSLQCRIYPGVSKTIPLPSQHRGAFWAKKAALQAPRVLLFGGLFYIQLAAPWVHPGILVHACLGVCWMCLIAVVGGEGGSCAPDDGNSWRELSCHWHAVSMPINKKVERIRGSYLNKIGWKLPACMAIEYRKLIQCPSRLFAWFRFGVLWNVKQPENTPVPQKRPRGCCPFCYANAAAKHHSRGLLVGNMKHEVVQRHHKLFACRFARIEISHWAALS